MPQTASKQPLQKSLSNERPQLSFRLKLTVLAVSLALLPVAIVGLISMNVNHRALKEANKDLLYSVLHHLVRQGEEDLRRDRDELSIAAASLLDTSQALEQRLSVVKALVGGGRLGAIAVYDESGAWIDTVKREGTSPAAFPTSLTPEMKAAVAVEEISLSKVRKIPNQKELQAWLVAKAHSTDSSGASATWYLASHFDLSRMQAELEEVGEERLGRGHTLLIVNDTQLVVADSQLERYGKVLGASEIGILKGVDPRAFANDILLFGETSANDMDMLGAARSMESLPWTVVAEVQKKIAYHSLTEIRLILWIVIAIASLVALVIAVFMARRISAPLQKLVSFAGDLANRRFDQRVTVHTRDELSLLGKALSSAASELEASDKRIRKEERIRSDLGRYLPETLVESIVEQDQELKLGGDRCEITVLFADVVGFTPLAETHSADEVVAILNELFTLLTEIVFRHEGTVDKFIGDSVMAFWGAPNPQPDHAAKALRAAEDMMRWLEIGNEGWKQKYGVEIQLAVGVNTGEAVVGNFGSKERMEYTCIGDCVNVAARLETIARPEQVLITAATKLAGGSEFDFLPLGTRQVVGRRVPIELFELDV